MTVKIEAKKEEEEVFVPNIKCPDIFVDLTKTEGE